MSLRDISFPEASTIIHPELIESLFGAATDFRPELESESTVLLERGLLYPLSRGGRLTSPDIDRADRLIALAEQPDGATRVNVVDREGRSRPVFRPLLIYAWARAQQLAAQTLEASVRDRWRHAIRIWCGELADEAARIVLPAGALPASAGGLACQAGWSWLALAAAGEALQVELWDAHAEAFFARLAREQQGSGAFLRPSRSDSPEAGWFHELVLLHALTNYAGPKSAAVTRATEFHLRETQPDHATSEPWAINAFAANPATQSLAEQMLHTVRLQGQPLSAVTSILLTDALFAAR